VTLSARYQPPANMPLAILFALGGIALFTPIFAAGKLAGGALPALVLVWLRFLGGAATISVYAAVSGVPGKSLKSPQWKLHLLRAGLGMGGLGAIIYAGTLLPVADVAAIALTKGIMAIGLARLILKEDVTVRHWLAGALCAGGAYLVIRSSAGGTLATPDADMIKGVVAAFLGAFFMACEALMIKVLSRREATVMVLGYVNVCAAAVLTVPVAALALTEGVNWSVAAAFLVLGPFAIAGQSFNIQAYRRADAAALAPIGYSWVVFAAIFGYLAFGEVPAPEAGAGAALIILGGVILTGWRPRLLPGR